MKRSEEEKEERKEGRKGMRRDSKQNQEDGGDGLVAAALAGELQETNRWTAKCSLCQVPELR